MKNNNFKIIFYIGIVLIIVGVILSFAGKNSNTVTYTAGIFCVLISFLPLLETLEGFGLKAKVRKLEESLESIISDKTYPEKEEEQQSNIEEIAKKIKVSHDCEIAIDLILRNLNSEDYMFFSATAIASKSNLSINSIKRIISHLYNLKLLEKVYSEKKGILYKISSKGKKVKLLSFDKEVDIKIKEDRPYKYR